MAMVRHLSTAPVVALDTESDGLHHFPEKVCLLQVAHPDGSVYLVDPLLLPDLAPLVESLTPVMEPAWTSG